MPRRICYRLSVSILLLILSFGPTHRLWAQAPVPQPITSLPKPPGYSTASNTAPNQVQPIGLLPQPAVDSSGASQPTTDSPTAPISQPLPATVEAPAGVPSPEANLPAATPVSSVPADVSSRATPLPVEPDLGLVPLRASLLPTVPQPVLKRPIRPFSAIAIQIKVGFAGFGLDVATPLAGHFNLRVGGSFFSYNGSYNVDGVNFAGDVKFRSGTASLDWFPFHNGFRISPGVTFYNGNNLNGGLSVPAGQTFDLGDGTYTSDPTGINPVHGTGAMTFGRRTAPSITMGFGNMIPRSGRHFSFPFELGFQYTGSPMINFNLQGTACDSTGCGDLATDPSSQANLKEELSEINSDISLLRFYPIISTGISYRF